MKRFLVTGDVHFQGYPYPFDVDERLAVEEYVGIVKKYNVPCVLFVSGRFLIENGDLIKEISKHVDIGGHTYECFQDFSKGKGILNKWFFGCNYGSKAYQKLDISKFVASARLLGLKITKWRTHEYASNQTTRKLLKDFGFSEIYDSIDVSENPKIINNEGLLDIPITIWPDDIYLLSGRMSLEKWFRETVNLMCKQSFTVFQLHPSAMKYLDDFKTFEKVCKAITS